METKLKKVGKSISLPGDTFNKIEGFEPLGELDFSGKIDVMALDYIAIHKHSLKEVVHIFDKEEIEILINACNMLILHTYDLSPAILIHNAITMYGKHFDTQITKEFEDKILKLTTAQSFAVLRVIQSYWIDKNYDRLEAITKK